MTHSEGLIKSNRNIYYKLSYRNGPPRDENKNPRRSIFQVYEGVSTSIIPLPSKDTLPPCPLYGELPAP